MRVLFIVLIVFATNAAAQGYAPDEAVAHMKLPDGFRAVLYAAEPDVRQPVCIEFDDRGRLWCVQYMQYPKPAGLKRVSVDRWSRTKYDHVPPPPPKGPKGDDAITIFEDLDGDGHADTHKNFVEGLNLCTGVAFGYGGVFVLQVPYLLFYPDKDRDDVPDSDPEVLLTGFGMEDAHSVANSLTWGPDGWLYGTQGSTVTTNINGIEFQQGVWRYHVEDRRFELFAEGGGNSWGLDFNEIGDCFASTNWGPFLCIHAEQGAYYVKSFGKHGYLHNPYAYGYLEHVTQNNPQGGHVTDGGIVYQGGAYPAEYNGRFIANNLLSHAVHFHDLTAKGSTYETTYKGALLDAQDLSFAPSDLTTGSDGFLYVADWNNRRTAHPDPEAEWNRDTGRIYQIAYGEAKPKQAFDLGAMPNGELIKYLDHPNYWFRRRARVLLASRQPELKQVEKKILEVKNPLERLWALNAVGADLDSKYSFQFEDTNTHAWTYRLLADREPKSEFLSIQILTEFAYGWKPDKYDMKRVLDPQTCRCLAAFACVAKRSTRDDYAIPVAAVLIRLPYADDDLHVPLLIWWAIEAHAMDKPADTVMLLATPEIWATRIGSETVLPRLVRRFTADASEAGDLAAVRMLELAPDEDKVNLLLAHVEQGLQDRGRSLGAVTQGALFEKSASEVTDEESAPSAGPVSEELTNTINRLYAEVPDNLLRLRLAVRIGNAEAYEAAKTRALKGPERVGALQLLSAYGKDDCIDLLLDTLRNDKDNALRLEALVALKHFQSPTLAKQLLNLYPNVAPELQAKLRAALLAKANWARPFLDAVDAGKIDPKDIPVDELRIVASHNDAALNALVEKHWGKIRAGTPEEKLAEMRRLNNELNFAKGDPEKGKQIFKDTCFKCHALFGEGGHVGPDLTQANRMDREFLLASIVDPSATVRKEYRQFTVTTKGLDVVSGVIAQGQPGTVTIFNANAEPTVLREEEIAGMEEQELSLMPEDQLKSMNGDAVRDLFAYIQGDATTKDTK